ncbi:hypothetical protein BJY52DRAFT_1228425 [Lactarius psammicola]|nr:hypothetical protein BJY52DRAFT_1228425 [Lactarius psammicola]
MSSILDGWAPGPVGEGTPYKLPHLALTLPKKFTAPLAHQHYEVQGLSKYYTFANVPIRINYDNLCQILLSTFLPHWLKLYANYPLTIANVESVWLMKGKNGIHLDNKEHAILEHCVGPNGNKLKANELNTLFFIDSDHLGCAEAHRNKIKECSQSRASTLTLALMLTWICLLVLCPYQFEASPLVLVTQSHSLVSRLNLNLGLLLERRSVNGLKCFRISEVSLCFPTAKLALSS